MKFSVQALYNWYRETIRNPKYRWWVILGTVAYIVSPFDLAPDFLPIVGQLDDVVLLTILVSEVSQILIDRVRTAKATSQPQTVSSESVTTPVDVTATPVE